MLGSIIIPAWNEAASIESTLRTLYGGLDPSDLEVIVACNGCTDDTVELARSTGLPAVVLDLPPIGKVGAIRAAEAMARAMPRLYLDADVRLTGHAARDVLLALRDGATAARPVARFDVAGASWPVRSFYRQRSRLPEVMADLCGAGVYGLSHAARERFAEFPNVIADDLFAARIVDRSEVALVECEPVVVRVPKNVASLTRTLARWYRGNRELNALMPAQAPSTTGSTVRQLVRSISGATQAVDALVYAVIVILGRVRSRNATHSWGRDDSTRTDDTP